MNWVGFVWNKNGWFSYIGERKGEGRMTGIIPSYNETQWKSYSSHTIQKTGLRNQIRLEGTELEGKWNGKEKRIR